MAEKLEIEYWEDRGDLKESHPDHVYGYVYFNDDSRVGFALNIPGEPDVWEPNTNGAGIFVPVTDKHLKMAVAYLREQGLRVRDV